MSYLKTGLQLARNMGGRYVAFRLGHELRVRTGLLRRKFPVSPPFETFTSLEHWKKQPACFFFHSRPAFSGSLPQKLAQDLEELKNGIFTFFSAVKYQLGPDYDWVTNPETGYRYPTDQHWTQVNDFDAKAGDIKYVWEKSRFSFLYTIIRYDAYSGSDHAEWVLGEILSWIKANPVNCGPNYKCSQEISLRVLNWTFALHFYKNSPALTEERFQQIMYAIYWQLRHVYGNIHFSRIAVRNNHALTETLALYLGGLLYPFFPEAAQWKTEGKKWFEEEVAYQVYEDGTYLQFSLNYQRVVVQLLSWAIRLSEANHESLNKSVYERADKCLEFLLQCIDSASGWLPNYGANDGALFFPLSDSHFRDFRPQLEALCLCLEREWPHRRSEEAQWYGLPHSEGRGSAAEVNAGLHAFDRGGYYLFRQLNTFTFIRCGSHKDRPSQADNLHLDIWHKGKNLLHDGGSYRYNAGEEELRYFTGTASHNSVMLGGCDQMKKGGRFIWYYWSQCINARASETDECYSFEGAISAFRHLDKRIVHSRTLKVFKKQPVWEIEDRIFNKPASVPLHQLWHTSFAESLQFHAITKQGAIIQPTIREGFVSNRYGTKEPCTEVVFSTSEDYVRTKIVAAG